MKPTTQDTFIAFCLALVSFFAAWGYNEWNVLKIKEQAPALLRTNNTIRTNDDASYYQPAKNFYLTHTWKDNVAGKQSFFVRPPGYGLFHWAGMEILGIDKEWLWYKYIQLFIFSLSVFFFYKTCTLLSLGKLLSIIATLLYGVTPFASGFLFYTLTESISPALLIGYTYFLLKNTYSENGKTRYLFIAAFLFAYLLLVRPVLGLAIVMIPIAVWINNKSWINKLLTSLTAISVATSFLFIWELRNYQIADEYVGLHPIYYAENNSQFRPTHQAIWNFAKGFESDGSHFHSYMVPLWQHAIKGDTSNFYIHEAINHLPDYVVNEIGKEKLFSAFMQYQASILYQKQFYDAKVAMPDTIPSIEQSVIKTFQAFEQQFKQKHPFQYHVITPLQVLKRLSVHSNLSLYIFQHTYRGLWWMEILRFLFLVINVSCFVGSLLAVFIQTDLLKKISFGWMPLLYIFYLSYFQRGIEERYMLPLIPVMLIGLFLSVQQIQQKLNY